MAKLRYSGVRPRLVRLIILAAITVLVISAYRRRHQLADRVEAWRLEYDSQDDCNDYPDQGNVAVVVKTGATEANRLIPTLLRTSLRCVKDPIIVSDLEQKIAGHTLHNVLAGFSPRAMDTNPDFDIYRLIQQYQADGRQKEIPKLADIPIPNSDWRTQDKSAAWGLDKYKNIRMVDLAWRLQPDRQWYVFIDADTYLVWSNLQQWLSTMNHSQPLYLGQPVRMYEHRPALNFGYGGAGIVLSGAAVRIYAEERPDLVDRWDRRIQGWWFGDFMLADALFEELDLRVTDATPMLGGDNSIEASYGPHNWCRPVITMHHIAQDDALTMYKVDRAAGSTVLRAMDVYNGTPRESLPKLRGDWDNRSEAEETQLPLNGSMSVYAHQSVTACEAACQSESQCFQYMFTQQAETAFDGGTKIDSQCFLSSIFRQGTQRDPARWVDGQATLRKSWISGWNQVRILAWMTAHGECGNGHDLWQLKPLESSTLI